MATVKPFAGYRPDKKVAARVAALPYDVYNRKEAREETSIEPLSFLCIDRPETQFAEDVDMYSEPVYKKAAEILNLWIKEGIFVKEEAPCYYLYQQTMGNRSQTGVVACSAVEDYENGVIRRHENTRAEKEADRIRHIETCNAQTGPIFLAFRNIPEIRRIMDAEKAKECLYDFTTKEGVGQKVWRIADPVIVKELEEAFQKIPNTYIADGHHRAASAVKVGEKKKAEAGFVTGQEEFLSFLSVLFPQEELEIMDYNRVVKDLNGRTPETFLAELKEGWELVPVSCAKEARPTEKFSCGLYLEKQWYRMRRKKAWTDSDPVKSLDVSILQDEVLAPILGIGDPRTDRRIDFVGGIRGLEELERRCAEDCKVAFAMYPTSMEELFAVADKGLLMPPKSTWFEPKLLSGLFVHPLS